MSGWANHIEPIKGTRQSECCMSVRQSQPWLPVSARSSAVASSVTRTSTAYSLNLALRFAHHGGVIATSLRRASSAASTSRPFAVCSAARRCPRASTSSPSAAAYSPTSSRKTLLATYQRGAEPDAGEVHFLSPGPNGSIEKTAADVFSLPKNSGQPWLIPRTPAQGELVHRVGCKSPCVPPPGTSRADGTR